MVYYDHGMLGATLAVAFGAPRRYGWSVVLLAVLVAMFPDWDALSKHISPETYRQGHRVWGHNLFTVTLAGIVLGGAAWLIQQSVRRQSSASLPAAEKMPLGPWMLLAVIIIWSHPLLDLLYCGLERNADWPVLLLWPYVSIVASCPARSGVSTGNSHCRQCSSVSRLSPAPVRFLVPLAVSSFLAL